MSHFDEEAQVENLKTWWKENWTALAAGVVVALGAIFGWQGWQRYQDDRATQASQMYEDMKRALDAKKSEEVVAIADKLVSGFASTPYASTAALSVAALDVEAGKLDDAAVRLQWVVTQGHDDGVKALARLRLARVQWSQNKLDDALKTLDAKAESFEGLYEELRGDIRLSQGDRVAARAAYEKALGTVTDNPAGRELLQRKLDDLADAVQS